MENTASTNENKDEIIAALKSEIEQLHMENADLKKVVEQLMEQIRLSRHKLFGASSEKTVENSSEEQLSFFNEAELCTDREKQVEAAVAATTFVAAHKRRKKKEYTLDTLPEGIPVEKAEHCIAAEDLVCPECGETMTEIGREIVRKLKIIPAKVVIVEDHYLSYACRRCEKEDIHTPVIRTPHEKSLIAGSFATPEAAAHIMTQKFVMGSPLYRQEQELNRMGISLSRQTMSNWILRTASDYLAPVYERLHAGLLQRDVLHADETELQVLREPGKTPQSKSYMWLYRTGGDTDRHIVLYEYQPGRSSSYPKAFLSGFKGYLHADGYSGYHSLPEEITVVGCWAHVRRKFNDAVKSLPKGKAQGSTAERGLAYCNTLFDIERELAELTPEERYEQRLKRAKPVLDAIFAWADSNTAAPKSALGKAFTYLREQRSYLMRYLEDGRLEISNNRAERSIKPFVIDRKNFLFANTPGGATGSAVIFSLIQTALENGLDPWRYLTWLMKNFANVADVDELLPWNVPDNCRAK